MIFSSRIAVFLEIRPERPKGASNPPVCDGSGRISFEDNPVPANAIAVTGERGIFRLRIGDFRALYRINYDAKKIIVVKIDKRERVYD